MSQTAHNLELNLPLSGGRLWRRTHCLLLSALLFTILLFSGCASRGGLIFKRFGQPDPVFTLSTSKADVFAHLNRNTQQVHAWRSSACKIKARGIPFKLDAVIACESPRRFRTVVKSLRGREVDFGSNHEQFWFWANEGPTKPVLYASHENLATAQKNVPIPFNPDWVMEVMGVIPFDASQFQMEIKADGTAINLASRTLDPQGRIVYRRIIVDPVSGFIRSHELYGAQRQLIARADVSDYRPTGPSMVPMPHHLKLSWPQTGMEFVMTLRDIDLNPSDEMVSEDQWEMPRFPNSEHIDIGSSQVRPVSMPGTR